MIRALGLELSLAEFAEQQATLVYSAIPPVWSEG